VVVGAEALIPQALLDLALGREQDHREGPRAALDGGQKLEAVPVREPQRDDRAVEANLGERASPRLQGAALADLMALVDERSGVRGALAPHDDQHPPRRLLHVRTLESGAANRQGRPPEVFPGTAAVCAGVSPARSEAGLDPQLAVGAG